jgi:DNA-3-methyladenine glycosylase
MKILTRDFYIKDSVIVARELLGKVLVHELNGERLAVKIVETEAYMGVDDKAAHSYGGKRTQRVEVMYGLPGFSYVFMIYGIQNCFNIVTREEGIPQAVLIRAGEPIEGLDVMAMNRFHKSSIELTGNQIKKLTDGPGKLCQGMAIDRSLNGMDLCGGKLYVTEGDGEKFTVLSSKRIGIDYAQEAKDYLWRFHIKDNPYVSVK